MNEKSSSKLDWGMIPNDAENPRAHFLPGRWFGYGLSLTNLDNSIHSIVQPHSEYDDPMNNQEYDAVEKPKHYMLFPEHNIEVRDVMKALVEKIEYSDVVNVDGMFISDYVQLMQYLMRFMDKNGFEDLKKSAWYLNKMIENVESQQ